MDGLSVVSIGFLLERDDDPVIWRGPKKNSMIQQFVNNVDWPSLDYLIIDTPPGTSDEHLSVIETLQGHNLDGCVMVTTPQNVALSDVRKEIQFCKQLNIRILGLVENMSGYECPNCHSCTNIFSSGGGKQLAQQSEIPYLGELPINPAFVKMIEQGFVLRDYHSSEMATKFQPILTQLLAHK